MLRPELNEELCALRDSMGKLRAAVMALECPATVRSDDVHSSTTEHLIVLAQTLSTNIGRSEATLSNMCVGHARLFSRLRDGQGCTLRTARNVLQWFSDHWPADLDWPTDIPRPPGAKEMAPECTATMQSDGMRSPATMPILGDTPGDRLKAFRKSRGLTQRDLAKTIGVSRSYIGDIEAARSQPSREFARKMANVYAVSADWLLFGGGAS